MVTAGGLLAISCSYLLGAVPFGLLFGRVLGGIDVRGVGSGNIGATNVLRAAGKKAAVLTLLADAFKGFLPVLLAARYLDGEWLPALAGIAAVLGHNYPLYLKFRGGKGVATSFGVVLGMSPGLGLVCLLAWALAAFLWRYSSLAALVAFALYPLLAFGVYADDRVRGFLSLFLFGMIYYRHRENIKRLLAGTEPKIGRKNTQ
jgi:glycerol-3-phosphate acyltransferase PlsY